MKGISLLNYYVSVMVYCSVENVSLSNRVYGNFILIVISNSVNSRWGVLQMQAHFNSFN